MKVYLIAGEVSGDLHGKNLLAALRQQHPEAQLRGVGGDGMAAQGMTLIRHIRETSFMGFSEVLKNLGKIRALFRDVKKDLLSWKPDVLVLIDYPGFNLKMAKFAREQNIRVVYYISPKVWAWKSSRAEKLKRYTNRLVTILPFETEFFAARGMRVDFVGHPLLDEMEGREYDDEKLRHLAGAEGKKILALLPGSRRQEITRMLPVMLKAASHFPEYRVVIAGAPGWDESFYRSISGNADVHILSNQTYPLLHAADMALVTSGTATLEAALFGVPQVVCYAGPALSVWLAKRLIHVKFISLVNLILNRESVRELIQENLNEQELTKELKKIAFGTPGRATLESDYRELQKMLGGPGASARAASVVAEEAKKTS